MEGKESSRKKKKWPENLADFFELPKELLLNLPRMTLVGNIQFYLENYGGIIEYSAELLRLKIRGGEIIVRGRNLAIKHFIGDEIFIEGEISSLEFQ